MSPRVLLLSLERATERRAQSLRQLRAEGADFEIVDAVDGLQCPDLPQRYPGTLKNAVVSCHMSHLRAYERIVAYGWPHAVVLEDDFALLRVGELGHVLEDAPENWDVIALHRFESAGCRRVVEDGARFNRLRPCGVCTHGQIVSRRFASYVLANHRLPEWPIDLLFCELSRDPGFVFLELAHPLVGLTGSPSFING